MTERTCPPCDHDCAQGRRCPARAITTRAGIRIGAAYRPKPAHDADAIRLQDALLEQRTATPLPPLQRLAGAIWGWL